VRNLEFKARLADPKAAIVAARAAGAELWGDLRQTDTYFAVPRGRLKLRQTAGYVGQLVYYERDEVGEGRASDYLVAPVQDAASLREALGRALGAVVEVSKRRTLLLLDTTRIHLDNVENLGSFLEIEVPVADGDEAAARARLDFLIERMGYTWEDCIRGSYADLLLGRVE
jgi:predicted adenylyl cyclase CyaB